MFELLLDPKTVLYLAYDSDQAYFAGPSDATHAMAAISTSTAVEIQSPFVSPSLIPIGFLDFQLPAQLRRKEGINQAAILMDPMDPRIQLDVLQ
jgi:hypothetical protein